MLSLSLSLSLTLSLSPWRPSPPVIRPQEVNAVSNLYDADCYSIVFLALSFPVHLLDIIRAMFFPSELSRSSAYAACNRPKEGLRNACLRRVLGVGPPIRRTTPRPFWRWGPATGSSLDSSGSSLDSSGSSLDPSGSSLDPSGSSGASTPPATPINRKHQVFIIIHFIHVYHNYCTGSLHLLVC